MEVTPKTLRTIREGLHVSRERLARKTEDLSIGTIRNAETNRRITVSKAQQILAAINALLTEKQQPTLGLGDLDIKLY